VLSQATKLDAQCADNLFLNPDILSETSFQLAIPGLRDISQSETSATTVFTLPGYATPATELNRHLFINFC
jgi:hypothetical protein